MVEKWRIKIVRDHAYSYCISGKQDVDGVDGVDVGGISLLPENFDYFP